MRNVVVQGGEHVQSHWGSSEECFGWSCENGGLLLPIPAKIQAWQEVLFIATRRSGSCLYGCIRWVKLPTWSSLIDVCIWRNRTLLATLDLSSPILCTNILAYHSSVAENTFVQILTFWKYPYLFAAKVFDAMEKAGSDMMQSTAVFTQDVVSHRLVPCFLDPICKPDRNRSLGRREQCHVI